MFNKIKISKKNFISNLKNIKNIIGHKKLCAVLKKNAYGHGIKEISSILKECNAADYIGVYDLDEALQVYDIIKDIPILVFGFFNDEDIEIYLKHGFHFTISFEEQLDLIEKYCKKFGCKANLEIMVDTGMNREGVRVEDFQSLFLKASSNPAFKIKGVYSHFAMASSKSERGKEFSLKQIEALKNIAKTFMLKERGILVHLENSDGILRYNDDFFDMARAGILSYGYSLAEEIESSIFKKVLSLESKVALVKEVNKGEGVSYDQNYIFKKNSKVAILPIGYANGISRGLSNKLKVLLNGKIFNQVGTICMDQMMVGF